MNTKSGKVGKLCLSCVGGGGGIFPVGGNVDLCVQTHCWCTRKGFVEILDIFKDKKRQIKL